MVNEDKILLARALEQIERLRNAPGLDRTYRDANGVVYVVEDIKKRLKQ